MVYSQSGVGKLSLQVSHIPSRVPGILTKALGEWHWAFWRAASSSCFLSLVLHLLSFACFLLLGLFFQPSVDRCVGSSEFCCICSSSILLLRTIWFLGVRLPRRSFVSSNLSAFFCWATSFSNLLIDRRAASLAFSLTSSTLSSAYFRLASCFSNPFG